MMFIKQKAKSTWTPALFPITLLVALLVLAGCNTQPVTQPPAGAATGFEFYVNPQAGAVTLLEPDSGETQLQPQSSPSDTRILTPDVDAALRNVGFQFVSPGKLVVRTRVENITADLDFAQPFFFTLNSASNNVINASAPLVTDQQLGGDGVLSPGEKSDRFRFEVTFKKNKPFTFRVDISAVVLGEINCTDPVVFPDPNLEAAVRDALNKPSGDVTCADMQSLSELKANRRAIENLEGLQNAVNLTTLDLAGNYISDLTPLQGLTNLTKLDLFYNTYVTDLTPLQGLTNLTYLDIGFFNYEIDDVTPLQGLTNLTYLDIRGNIISDITPLQGLTNLTTLRLFENRVSDLTPLQGFTDLTYLDLRNNHVSDTTPLQGLTNLTFLDLAGNSDFAGNTLSDITPLQGLVNLTTLYLDGNEISDITPLQGLIDLTELELASNDISDISALVNNSGLGSGDLVDLRSNPLSTQALADVGSLEARGVTVILQ